MKIFLILILFSSLYSIDEIKYSIVVGALSRVTDSFSVRFNKKEGIKAEYEQLRNDFDISQKRKGKKLYNLTCEELGLPSLKTLFKQFDKIKFPNETNWTIEGLFDVPTWNLYVDDKHYYSNGRTEFLEDFSNIVNLTNIKRYCISKY